MTDWLSSYRRRLGSDSSTGHNLKNQSDVILDYTFKRDVNYKRVYILSKDGWKYEDAKYQTHTTPSILKDNVDYYLQFKSKIHYPIGTYVIVPDDTSFDINLTDDEKDNPFTQPVDNRTQWWLIVGRDDANQFVRYSILKCNWNFQWIYNGQIQSCFGCTRNSNSYRAGQFTDEYMTQLDNISSAWLPDIYYVYKDNYASLGMNDTRSIDYLQRFMIGNNPIHPKVFTVSKVVELAPEGLIKLTLKQDEFNSKRDNIELKICDYYSDSGNYNVNVPIVTPTITKTSSIKLMIIDSDGYLEESNVTPAPPLTIDEYLGVTSYFKVEFSASNIKPMWKIELIQEDGMNLNNKPPSYYVGLMKLTTFDDNSISIKPGKAKSLINKKFTLTVSDEYGEYKSNVILEVKEVE